MRRAVGERQRRRAPHGLRRRKPPRPRASASSRAAAQLRRTLRKRRPSIGRSPRNAPRRDGSSPSWNMNALTPARASSAAIDMSGPMRSSIASPTNTRAPTFARRASSRAWARTLRDLGRSAANLDPPISSARPARRTRSWWRGTRRSRENRRAGRRVRRRRAAASNMRPCSACAMSQVGWRLIVASSAKISRPRPLHPRRRALAASTNASTPSRSAGAPAERHCFLAHAESPGAGNAAPDIDRSRERRAARPGAPALQQAESRRASGASPRASPLPRRAASRSSGASF